MKASDQQPSLVTHTLRNNLHQLTFVVTAGVDGKLSLPRKLSRVLRPRRHKKPKTRWDWAVLLNI